MGDGGEPWERDGGTSIDKDGRLSSSSSGRTLPLLADDANNACSNKNEVSDLSWREEDGWDDEVARVAFF
jgi:hypothetical protein